MSARDDLQPYADPREMNFRTVAPLTPHLLLGLLLSFSASKSQLGLVIIGEEHALLGGGGAQKFLHVFVFFCVHYYNNLFNGYGQQSFEQCTLQYLYILVGRTC